MPGKRDVVVIKEDGNKTTYQKRILLYNIREVFELFRAENPGTLFGFVDFNNILFVLKM
jgi:hypothetical protein